MKTLLRLLPFLALAFVTVRAADDKLLAAVRAADAERVAATMAGDRARLDAIFSDALHYSHSSGHIDTKASYMQALVSRASIYSSYKYVEQTFTPVGPGIVLMTGRALIRAGTATSANDLDLNFLAVWREENGKWRFLAWQSCKNPPPTAPAPASK